VAGWGGGGPRRRRPVRGPAGRAPLLAAVLAVLGGMPVAAGAVPPAPLPPDLHARSAAVLDLRDGAVLWALRGRLRLPMASTTKMMTALVALDLLHDRVDVPMVVPPEVREAYGETLGLRPGEQYTFLQLLEGMLLPSANDAAIAIAVNAAGSERRFVELMNARARALGLVDTHFANPDGLEDPDHYSSAIDLARLGQAALQDPVIRRIVVLRSAALPRPDGPGTLVVGNINALIGRFPGATGIKTGYTSEARNVVVGSAEQGGQAVVAVVMGEPAGTLWSDEEQLLRFGLALAAARAAPETSAAGLANGTRAAELAWADGAAASPPPEARPAEIAASPLPALPARTVEGRPPSESAGAVPQAAPQTARPSDRGRAGWWARAIGLGAACLGAAAVVAGRGGRRRGAPRRPWRTDGGTGRAGPWPPPGLWRPGP
jgi:D-alanyl-D-alanine carboxypeptidase (penicillin-binding protein 5/6)